MFDKEIFSENVKRLIRERNTTQAAVASEIRKKYKIPLSESSLSKILKGPSKPSAEVVFALADYFGISADQIGSNGPSQAAVISCREFCQMIANLAESRQLAFSVIKRDEVESGFDEYGEWYSKRLTLPYAAIVLPRNEFPSPFGPDEGDVSHIQSNCVVNDFLESFAQIAKNGRNGKISDTAYSRIVKALINDVPSDLPLYRAKKGAVSYTPEDFTLESD